MLNQHQLINTIQFRFHHTVFIINAMARILWEVGVLQTYHAGRATQSWHQVGADRLEVLEGGNGAPLVILPDQFGALRWEEYQEKLAEAFHLFVPAHPGFGHSTRPDWLDTVDDVAFCYQDWIAQLNEQLGEPVHLMGLGLGGWIAAELAVRCSAGLQSLTLVDAVGIKVSDRETQDVANVFEMSAEALDRLLWANPDQHARRLPRPQDPELDVDTRTVLFQNLETAALLTWRPYMHNPKLKYWLHRIAVPTLVLWGERDGVVSSAYGQAYAAAIPGARFTVLPEAGHLPYLERPDAFVGAVLQFLTAVSAN
jgi:pimeloyl-ACP methyl ester carboxylesterase